MQLNLALKGTQRRLFSIKIVPLLKPLAASALLSLSDKPPSAKAFSCRELELVVGSSINFNIIQYLLGSQIGNLSLTAAYLATKCQFTCQNITTHARQLYHHKPTSSLPQWFNITSRLWRQLVLQYCRAGERESEHFIRVGWYIIKLIQATILILHYGIESLRSSTERNHFRFVMIITVIARVYVVKRYRQHYPSHQMICSPVSPSKNCCSSRLSTTSGLESIKNIIPSLSLYLSLYGCCHRC